MENEKNDFLVPPVIIKPFNVLLSRNKIAEDFQKYSKKTICLLLEGRNINDE